jgi:ATP-dependent protease ClpP protease subunit
VAERKQWFKIFRNSADVDCTQVMVYDDIGAWGVGAKDFCNEFNAIKTPKIDIHINSPGGDAFDGIAIHNAIKGHDAEVTAYIDGLAASAASVIAVGADKICMAKNAMMMIHDASVMAFGSSADLRKQADMLDKLDDCIATSYVDKTGQKIEDVRAAMDAETWYTAAEAKAWGLADEISEDDGDELGMAASAAMALTKYQKAPPSLRRFAAKLTQAPPVKKETQMDKIVCRDGKYFLGDVEVDASALPAPVAETSLSKAREEGARVEREYRAMFNTVLDSAKITGEAAKNFEKEFYGRAEADLKFLASHSIGTRAQPLGESAPGNGEGDPGSTANPEAKAVTDAGKRWANDARLRRMHGCTTDNVEDPQYKNKLARYLRVAAKSFKDQKAGGNFDAIQEGDAISAALKNSSMIVRV